MRQENVIIDRMQRDFAATVIVEDHIFTIHQSQYCTPAELIYMYVYFFYIHGWFSDLSDDIDKVDSKTTLLLLIDLVC